MRRFQLDLVGSRASAAIGQPIDVVSLGGQKSLRTRGCGRRLEPFPPFTLRQQATTRDLEAPAANEPP